MSAANVLPWLPMADLNHLADQLSDLTLREVIQLARTLIQRAGGGTPVSAGADGYTLTLQSTGYNKIQVIKVVREITALGLADTKRLVESAPQRIAQGLSHAEAETWARRLIEAGATPQIDG